MFFILNGEKIFSLFASYTLNLNKLINSISTGPTLRQQTALGRARQINLRLDKLVIVIIHFVTYYLIRRHGKMREKVCNYIGVLNLIKTENCALNKCRQIYYETIKMQINGGPIKM